MVSMLLVSCNHTKFVGRVHLSQDLILVAFVLPLDPPNNFVCVCRHVSRQATLARRHAVEYTVSVLGAKVV